MNCHPVHASFVVHRGFGAWATDAFPVVLDPVLDQIAPGDHMKLGQCGQDSLWCR